MASEKKHFIAFNRGVVSALGSARVDLDRLAMSADTHRNFIPRVLGSMMFRPGLEFIDNTLTNAVARNLPFIFDADDKALVELASGSMRVRVNDVVITRPAVTATVLNGSFGSGLTSWTNASDTGGVASAPAGYALLSGDGSDFGRIRQTVTVIETGTEHALAVDVQEGPVLIKVGSTAGTDNYVEETRLERGYHSLAFTPTGNFVIELANERTYNAWVDSIQIESAGEMTVLTPWSANDLPYLRWEQSGDVIYVACKNGDVAGPNAVRPTRIERRGDGRSWSVVDYLPEDGPFRVMNTSGISMTPSAIYGDISITASQPFFKQEHTTHNALIRIEHAGQTVSRPISAEDTWTEAIRVTGKGTARTFGIIIEGTFTATLKLQFAFTDSGPWNDQPGKIWTAPTIGNFADGQDDQIIYYRLGIDVGGYSSGTAVATLIYSGGSTQGIARLRNYSSSTVVFAQVLKNFGSIDASKDWWEGEWSERRGYPTAVALHEGRLIWAGNDRIWGSVSDDFESFDENFEGDAGPLSRSIGQGPIKTANWVLSMARLLIGVSENCANVGACRMDGNQPLSVRSSSFDEPLTPTNFNVKTTSSKGVFVDRSGQRLYELSYDIDVQDYKAIDLSVFTPDFNEVGIVQIAVQMKPDIRIHCVRSDGTVGMLVYDRLENVICWLDVDSPGATGLIEDVAVLPGTVEDEVYYIVKRTINGGTERHICKWAMESEAIGGTVNKQTDSFVHYSGGQTNVMTGLGHLEGETVYIWADGADVGTAVVASGQITLNGLYSEIVAGLYYSGQFKSGKLGGLEGIGLLDEKKVNRIGFIAQNLHYRGLQYGPSFDQLYDLPGVEGGQEVAAETVHATYHEDQFAFGGEWDTDSRICLQAESPKPCTILAAIVDFESLVDRKS